MTVKTVGLDLAKDVFVASGASSIQVHGISETGRRISNKKIKRVNLLAFFEALPRCVVGMEACGSAHHWGRALRKLGHDVRLMPFFATNAPPERSLDARTLCQTLCEAWQNGRGRRRGDL